MPVHVMVRAEPARSSPLPSHNCPTTSPPIPGSPPSMSASSPPCSSGPATRPPAGPATRSIAARVGRSVATVQRALRTAPGPRTGRPREGPARPTPTAPAGSSGSAGGPTGPPVMRADPPVTGDRDPRSPVTDEGRNERERERPIGDAGPEGPPPSAADLELWRGWAAGRRTRPWPGSAARALATRRGRPRGRRRRASTWRARLPPRPRPSCPCPRPPEDRPMPPPHAAPPAPEADRAAPPAAPAPRRPAGVVLDRGEGPGGPGRLPDLRAERGEEARGGPVGGGGAGAGSPVRPGPGG